MSCSREAILFCARQAPLSIDNGRDITPHELQAALERLTVTQAVKAGDVTWVLTVPVCCSEPAKYFMRKAAIQAGYLQGGHDDEVSHVSGRQSVP